MGVRRHSLDFDIILAVRCGLAGKVIMQLQKNLLGRFRLGVGEGPQNFTAELLAEVYPNACIEPLIAASN